MPFKFHTFFVDEDDDLCKARPGSPPAFFSLPSPASPRICGNCMPGLAAASTTAASAAAHQSSGPSREPLPQQQVRTEALAKVRHQKSADKDVLKFKDKKSAEKQVFECHSENQELTMDNLDDIIRRLIDVQSSRPGKVDLSETEIRHLCAKSRDIFLSEANLLELESPVKVCGDIHGQYSDLLRLFEYGGFPPNANYLFLGNYVDYGKQGLKTMCLLLAYKIKYPEKFFLLRGNHECASINRIDGFYDECKRRFNVRVWKGFTYCFNCLPVAALVDDKILCIHGGLSPALTNLDQIRNIPRPTDVPDTGLLCDLLWSDPDRGVQGWGMNDRGVSYTFGPDKVSEFLARHGLDLVCRGHKVVEDGYEFFADRQLVTIFSAPNYRGEFDNAGAMMSIDENMMCTFQILKPEEKKPRFLSLGR